MYYSKRRETYYYIIIVSQHLVFIKCILANKIKLIKLSNYTTGFFLF